MLKAVEQKLEEANKLIFVKRYGEAEKLIDEIVASPEGSAELIIHLRRIELAAMLKKLDKLRTQYQRELKSGSDHQIDEVCLALVEQHGDFVSAAESINTFQEI